MDTDGSRDDERSPTQHLSRRRVLALSGAGVLGSIAGCSGDGGGDAVTPTATGTSTETATATATPTEGPTATPTEEPTPTPSMDDLIGEYDCADVAGDPDIVVAQDGSGDYETVQAAIEAIPDRDPEGTVVAIEAGRYEEKLHLPRHKLNVAFVGEDPQETVLTYDDHANKTDDRGNELGTGGSASFTASATDFTAANLTFENAAEPVAQAVAVKAQGDRQVYRNCRFLGNQDTLYTLSTDRQYYRDCYVEGDVDFIFGASTAYFEGCEIFCKADGGYVTAASTTQEQSHGYVFNNCEFTADGAADDSFYLGRPWRPYARTVIMNSYLGDHIHPAGWHNWDDPDKEETATYAEYENEGPGFTPEERVEWSSQLSDFLAGRYEDPEEIFGDWNPAACF